MSFKHVLLDFSVANGAFSCNIFDVNYLLVSLQNVQKLEGLITHVAMKRSMIDPYSYEMTLYDSPNSVCYSIIYHNMNMTFSLVACVLSLQPLSGNVCETRTHLY